MRKIVWFACLTGLLAAADVVCTAVYVYQHPDSYLARSRKPGSRHGPRLQSVPVRVFAGVRRCLKMMGSNDGSVAQNEHTTYESPEEPVAVQEEENLVPAPLAELQCAIELPLPHGPACEQGDEEAAWIAGEVIPTQEPPLAEGGEVGTGFQLSGFAGCRDGAVDHGTKPASEACQEDDNLTCWFWKTVEDCVATSQKLNDAHWFGYWYSYFSSPSTLEYKGDAEDSEPIQPLCPDDCQEDPNAAYHHEGCPYTGVSPIPARRTRSQPTLKPPKKKMKRPVKDDGEESELPMVHPEIDTMEFRNSDRSWDDYGDPFQQ